MSDRSKRRDREHWECRLSEFAIAHARSGISPPKWLLSIGENVDTGRRYITIKKALDLIDNTDLLDRVGMDNLTANFRREKILSSAQFMDEKYVNAAISRGSPADDFLEVEALMLVADINRLHDLLTKQDGIFNEDDVDSKAKSLPLMSVTEASCGEEKSKTTVRQAEPYSAHLVRTYEQLIKVVAFQVKARNGGSTTGKEAEEITRNVMTRLDDGGVDALDAARILGGFGVELPVALALELKQGFNEGLFDDDGDGLQEGITDEQVALNAAKRAIRINQEREKMATRKRLLDGDGN